MVLLLQQSHRETRVLKYSFHHDRTYHREDDQLNSSSLENLQISSWNGFFKDDWDSIDSGFDTNVVDMNHLTLLDALYLIKTYDFLFGQLYVQL